MPQSQMQDAAIPARPKKKCVPVNFNIPTIRMLDYLVQKKGFNRTVVITLAVQRMAEQEGYK